MLDDTVRMNLKYLLDIKMKIEERLNSIVVGPIEYMECHEQLLRDLLEQFIRTVKDITPKSNEGGK